MGNHHLYNVVVTLYTVLMLFFLLVFIILNMGFDNRFVPIMLGAKDMVFPRLNNVSFGIIASFLRINSNKNYFLNQNNPKKLFCFTNTYRTFLTSRDDKQYSIILHLSDILNIKSEDYKLFFIPLVKSKFAFFLENIINASKNKKNNFDFIADFVTIHFIRSKYIGKLCGTKLFTLSSEDYNPRLTNFSQACVAHNISFFSFSFTTMDIPPSIFGMDTPPNVLKHIDGYDYY